MTLSHPITFFHNTLIDNDAIQQVHIELLSISSFLIDYRFAEKLFLVALDVLERLSCLCPTVILSNADIVFQPRKVERAGLFGAVEGRVLIYIHKEEALDDVERRYAAELYVLVDDKLRILAAVKRIWRERVTTVFLRRGSYAHYPKVVSDFPPADVTMEQRADAFDRYLLLLRTAPSLLESGLKVMQ